MMQSKGNVKELRQLIKDARWAIWAFVIINFFVIVFFIVDGLGNEFVFIALFVQVVLFVIWLLPVFFYQVFIKKLSVKYAFYTSMASYKEVLGHVSW
ncbi:hypothetical protein ACM9HF_02375 [Colwellia sp. RE-S-Sl-9]